MAPFVVVLCAIAYKMYNNAVDLSVVYKQGDIDVWSIFITRLPYVVVSVAIIQSCAFFVNKLTNEIIAVDRKRLNLSTLSIIARDVSRSSAFGKKFTDEERYEKEIHLKMEMMKDHMRQYISEDFAYKSPFDFLSTLSRHRQDKQSDTKAAMDSKPTQP
jgi:hypothetical protein